VSWFEKLFAKPSTPPLLVRFHHPRRRPKALERIALSAEFLFDRRSRISTSNAVLEQQIFLAQGVGVMPPFGRARETRFFARFEDGAHAEFRVRPADAAAGVVHDVTLTL
jgi:hypothetical protein